MFELKNEAALIATFRYSERRRVELSSDLRFPIVVDDYLTWPFGKRVFLVFAPRGDVPRGIVFESSDPGPPVSHMCDWCQQGGLGAHVGLLTARRSRIRSAGILVCSDLGCRGRLEHAAERSGKDAEPAIRALLERMRRFADSLDFGPVLS